MNALGAQGHVSKPMADTVWERVNIMAGQNLENRVLITELDVEDKDVDKRAEDLDDVLRTIYSHPNVDAVLLWTWSREVVKYGRPDPPFNRALFESNLNIGDEPVARPEVCDEYDVVCNYPLNPNRAGVRFLNMIKRDWNTTTGNGNVDFLDMDRLIEPVDLFKGDYKVSVFNEQNELIETDFMTVDAAQTCTDLEFVEFENDTILTDSMVQLVGGSYYVVSDGYVGNGLKVSDRTHSWQSIRFDLTQYGR